MFLNYLLWITEITHYLMFLHQNELFCSLVLVMWQVWWVWWNSSTITQGVCPTPSRWVTVRMCDVTLCDFCAMGPCGFFRSLTWKAFGTIVLGKICFVILLASYSSFSGLVFPCFIHGDDTGFTLWVELNVKSFVVCIGTILEFYFMYIFIIYSRLVEFHSSFK